MAYYLIDFENVKSRGMEGVELLAEEDIDGGLIGGAALKPEQFVDIINAANQE